MEHKNRVWMRSPSAQGFSPVGYPCQEVRRPLRYEEIGSEAQQLSAPTVADAVLARKIRNIQRARTNRGHLLPHELFSDPAWDMLLELFVSSLTQRRVSVSGLSSASGVPATTALRWLNTLEEHDLVVRCADPLDARRVFVMLSSKGSRGMREYFNSLPSDLHPL
jgi:DNA-binding MarR family transcriptional regulator